MNNSIYQQFGRGFFSNSVHSAHLNVCNWMPQALSVSFPLNMGNIYITLRLASWPELIWPELIYEQYIYLFKCNNSTPVNEKASPNILFAIQCFFSRYHVPITTDTANATKSILSNSKLMWLILVSFPSLKMIW